MAKAGYALCLGVNPLSPARSLLILDAPVLCEHEYCLPQLHRERPHGGDLDSHLCVRLMFMCYAPSPVLASVGDTGFVYGEQGPSGAQTHAGNDILEEANLLSFQAFRKTRTSACRKKTPPKAVYSKEATRRSPGLSGHSQPPKPWGFACNTSGRLSKTRQGLVASWRRRKGNIQDNF